jgi:CheY-like chemotaxis protein
MIKSKTVLIVGNCDHDHGQLKQLIESFAAGVLRAHTIPEALQVLETEVVDLVLVNRMLDRDNSQGLELVRGMQTGPSTKKVPVMLVSNFPEAQSQAIEEGAAPGFGKDCLNAPTTRQLLLRYLG